MNKLVWFFVMLVALVGTAFYLSRYHEQPQPVEPITLPAETRPIVEVEEPVIRYPVAAIVPDKDDQTADGPLTQEPPLPSLDNSDESMRASLNMLPGAEKTGTLFVFREFIRHFVVTVDNLPRKKLPQRFRLTQRPPGSFVVEQGRSEDEFFLDERNFVRYAAFIGFLDMVEMQDLVEIYRHYYPLFQEAYDELGYPASYFNDRLVEVIDHLLATPDTDGVIKLVRPKVFYQFAEPELEALSSGQKIIVRMGRDNAMKVKAGLRELRQRLTTLPLTD